MSCKWTNHKGFFFHFFFLFLGEVHRDGVMSPPLFSFCSVSEDENDRENLTELWGFLPGLIQGCITFSVSPVESQNNFVFSLLNRREPGLLYTKSGRNRSLLTQSQGRLCVRYIMSQGLKSGATVPDISVIKISGLFYLPSHFWLSGLYFEALHPKPKGIETYRGWGLRWSQIWNSHENTGYLKVCD